MNTFDNTKIYEVTFQIPDNPYICTGIYIGKTDLVVYVLLPDGTTTGIIFDYIIEIKESIHSSNKLTVEQLRMLQYAKEFVHVDMN